MAQAVSTDWHNTAAARRVLSRILPSDMALYRHTATIGPDELRWTSCGRNAELEAIRKACVEQAAGKAFRDCLTYEDCRAYMDADALFPSLDDVFEARFGNPGRFDGIGVEGANAAWQRECAASALAGAA